MISLAWTILWLPFGVAVLIALLLQKKPKAAALLSTGSSFICFALSAFIFITFQGTSPSEHSLIWMAVDTLHLEYGILLNPLTLIMTLIVTGVGSLIFLYSLSYMEEDPSYGRFFACLSLFLFSMLGIVFANNLIQIFIHWELVGLSSYLLIGFWYKKFSASTAGKKAFLTTRVGDVGMMIGILILFALLAGNNTATFNFLQMESVIGKTMDSSFWLTAAGILIFMGVVGKSAQVPLHVWLPDAMEGPTPVSALIHAATMVAAGVFLLARLSFLYEISATASTVIAWTGGITAFIAATLAIVQDDIKKILAYSTLSQLGYMVLACGLGNADGGMFHLTTHAFFKALLFLGAGNFIHAFHTQDIWSMKSRGIFKEMPVTSIAFLFATFALMGIPPTSGFFSKEEVLLTASHGPAFLFFLSMAVVFFTAFYMGRLSAALFVPNKNASAHAHEPDWKMTAPLIVLAFLSAVGGFLPIKHVVSGHAEAHHGSHLLLAGSLALATGGFLISIFLYRNGKEGAPKVPGLSIPKLFLEKKFFFDDLYDLFISKVQDSLARLSDVFEKIVVIEAFVNGTANSIRYLGDRARKLQTGVVQFYALLFVLGIIGITYYLAGRA